MNMDIRILIFVCSSLQGTYSIVLMAVVDSRYLFRLVDVGAPGRISDGGVFKESPIGQRLQHGKLNLPRAAQLPGSQLVCPHVFVGDAAFQLRPDFMRPLPGSRADNLHDMIYNYRVSRARYGSIHCNLHNFGTCLVLPVSGKPLVWGVMTTPGRRKLDWTIWYGIVTNVAHADKDGALHL